MMRNRLVYMKLLTILGCSILLAWLFADREAHPVQQAAEHGLLNVTDWSFENDGPVELKGEWEFYWGRLLSPEELSRSGAPPADYARLPASWNSDRRHPADGYATYRLHVSLKESPRLLALNAKSIASSYRIWIDGELAGGMGQVGTSRDSSLPQDAPAQYVFHVKEGGVDIVVQAANFAHRRGGLWEELELGTPQHIQGEHVRQLALDLVLFGSLFMMGLYHLVLYLMRRRERTALYFGLFCLIIAVRTLLVGEVFLYELFPQLAWSMRIRIEYWGAFLGLPIFALFIRELYPREMSRLVVRFTVFAGFGYAAVTAFAEPQLFTRMMPSFQLIILACALYVLAVLFRATIHSREGALLATIGGSVYVISVANDILYFNEMIKTGSFSPLGLFVFIALDSAVLSMKFSRSLASEELMALQLARQAEEVRMLNDRLQDLNRDLEAGIAERTEELQQSNRDLAKKAAEIAQLDDARRQLLSDISHELRTPMTSIRGYVEALLDHIFVTAEEQRQYLQLVLNKMIGLNRLIADLFELSKLESGQTDLQFHSVPTAVFLERTRVKYELDVIDSGLAFEWDIASLVDLPKRSNVVLDPERIDQVLTNLVANAIRCTPPKGTIGFRFLYRNNMRAGEPVRELVVHVEDTGRGIEEDDMPMLFERFYRGKEATAGASGLGLAIAKELVTHHGGSIWAMRREGGGSIFGFSLLLYEEEESLG